MYDHDAKRNVIGGKIVDASQSKLTARQSMGSKLSRGVKRIVKILR